MKKQYTLILLAIFTLYGFTSDNPAYKLYKEGGKEVKYSKMMEDLQDADIVFFGELHTDPIAHWLELEMTEDFYELRGDDLVLGAEMFEADNQLVIDEYLDSLYPANKFEVELKLWKNYTTDYKPLLEFAKEKKLDFVATDIPRRYASITYNKGFEGLEDLSDEAKQYIAPLPFHYDPELKCYKDMMSMEGMGGHVNENFPKSQASKDATMAYFILKNWETGKLFFHYNGAYHSENFQGIVWHLLQYNPDLKIKTVTCVQQDDVHTLKEENQNLANYMICIPDNMTMTNR